MTSVLFFLSLTGSFSIEHCPTKSHFLTMEQFEFHPFAVHPINGSTREWKTLEPGITQLTLNYDPATSRGTYLQRWEPRTENQIQTFEHDYIEEIFIVEGDFRDLKGRASGSGEIVEGKGGDVWTKGSYAYRNPEMEHGPFRSETGCLMFIVCIPVEKEKGEVGFRKASGTSATAL